MGDHAADGAPEDAGRGTIMEGALRRVGIGPLAQELHVAGVVTRQAARDHELLASHHDHLLARKQLLGHNRGQPAEQVPTAVDDHLLGVEGHPCAVWGGVRQSVGVCVW